MHRPLVLAGSSSGAGKTTVTTGIMAFFRSAGLRVAPFKVGPDYIDPGYHYQATGRRSRNLDTWLTSPETTVSIYDRGSGDADISVVEGVMGLFDGRAGARDSGSTAEVARLIDGAVILVVDCSGMSRSLAPLLWGFDRFEGSPGLTGVIFNNVSSLSHARMLREAAGEARVAVLGEIPHSQNISLKSRHLGLVPAAENDNLRERIEETAEFISRHVDTYALLEMAGVKEKSETNTADLSARGDRGKNGADADAGEKNITVGAKATIAVARDDAFSFYYVDGLEALEKAGAKLVYFSPLRDDCLPLCDGIYLGGGFPEVFAADLEANGNMRRSIADAAGGGLPVYAECGGMLYLCRGIETEGKRYEMAGVIGSEARMTGRRQALGYVEAKARRTNILTNLFERVRGHQFHWSSIKWQEEFFAYDCFSTKKPDVEPDGYCRGNILASYVHIHFAGENQAAERFVNSCARSKCGETVAAAKKKDAEREVC